MHCEIYLLFIYNSQSEELKEILFFTSWRGERREEGGMDVSSSIIWFNIHKSQDRHWISERLRFQIEVILELE